ncbi:dynein heavy chain, partial [Coemansia sp. RSA 921]
MEYSVEYDDPERNAEGATRAPYCEPGYIQKYLMGIVPVLLGGADEAVDSAALSEAIASAEGLGACQTFGTDSSVSALYVSRDIGSDGTQVKFEVSFELAWKPTYAGSVAVIKRVPVIDTHEPVARQVQAMNLPGPASVSGNNEAFTAASAADADTEHVGGSSSVNPYEALHAFMRFAVSPYFNAYVSAKEKAEQQHDGPGGHRDDKDAQQGVPMAKKKLAELELSLLHLQQNVDIPETVLNIHPDIARTVAD